MKISFAGVMAGLTLAFRLAGQTTCPILPDYSDPSNLFSPELEAAITKIYTGGAFGHVNISDDPAVTSYLKQVGDRLSSHVMQRNLQFRYHLIDLPGIQAFSLPGGDIYVHPRLAGALQTEHELAGVLAHEMGHIVTHQASLQLSNALRRELHIESLKTEQDVELALTRLFQSWMRNRPKLRHAWALEERRQEEADAVALTLVTQAGYSPVAFESALGRITGVNGHERSWLADALGLTNEDQHRIHKLISTMKRIPDGCLLQRASADPSAFHAWQVAVLDYADWPPPPTDLHDVISQTQLQPIRLADYKQTAYSPDGKWILAVDEDHAHLLSAHSLGVIASVPSHDALQVQFDSSSSKILLTNSAGRIDVWDIAQQKTSAVYRLTGRPFLFMALSPDGKVASIVNASSEVQLIDVSGNRVIWQKHWNGVLQSKLSMTFSPDGRYFVAIGSENVTVYDTKDQKEVKLHDDFQQKLSMGVGFLSTNEIVAFPMRVEGLTLVRTAVEVFSFPDGHKLKSVPIHNPALFWSGFWTPTHSNSVVFSPCERWGACVLDLDTGKIDLAGDRPVIDLYGDHYVRPFPDGSVGIFGRQNHTMQTRTGVVDANESGTFIRSVISPDWTVVAGCGGLGCANWEVATGTRLGMMRKWDAAVLDPDNILHAAFPAKDKSPYTIADLDARTSQVKQNTPAPKGFSCTAARGDKFLLRTNEVFPLSMLSRGGSSTPDEWQVRDVKGNVVWSRRFKDAMPDASVQDDRVLLVWTNPKPELKNFPDLQARYSQAGGEKSGMALVEIVNLPGNTTEGATLIAPGASKLFAVGDRLFSTYLNHTTIISLKSGKELDNFMGILMDVAANGKVVVTRDASGRALNVYDVGSTTERTHFAFPHSVAMAQFNATGTELVALTNDQMIYKLRCTAAVD